MNKQTDYRTWSRQRACRLPSSFYEGLVVHVIIVSCERKPVFAAAALASEVFALVNGDRSTVAACLMPDHLHWLFQVTADVSTTVSRFKSTSTRIGWRLGRPGALWQRTFYDRVMRDPRETRETAKYITENPVRGGLVEEVADYPYQVSRVCG